MSIIISTKEARTITFERVVSIINDEHLNKLKNTKISGVWAANDMIPYVDGDYKMGLSSLQFACTLGEHEFNYSISLCLGEVRIGIVVPNSLAEVSNNLLKGMSPYPQDSSDPRVITRNLLGRGWLIDYVFNTRFGSLEVTKAALDSKSKSDPNIELLADAIALELIHINHSLMHCISENGLLVMSDGIYSHSNAVTHVLISDLPVNTIVKELGIEQNQLWILGDHRYSIISPVNILGIEEKINQIGKMQALS